MLSVTILRADALELGLTRYNTGEHCKNGHTADRLVSNRGCVTCLNERNYARRTSPEERAKAAARTRNWVARHPERAAIAVAAWRKDNRQRQRELEARAPSRQGEHRKRINRRTTAKWRKANLETGRLRNRAYSKRVRRATPAWADRAAIRAFYAACPPGFQVDHEIPLHGKNVCGLHVLENLQYLTASENAAKGNQWPWEGSTSIHPFHEQEITL